MRKFGGMVCVWMALFMVTGFQVSDAAEQLIKEFVDLIQERGTAEWVDACERPVGLEIIKADQAGDGVHDYSTYEYSTLVGWDTDPNPPDYGGYSGQTCEYNDLYYQRDIRRPGLQTPLDMDLYRMTVRFLVQ